jgi:hypothetical protein
MIRIEEGDVLLDVDEAAWGQVIEARGGCTCHVSPPCNACAEPVTEEDTYRALCSCCGGEGAVGGLLPGDGGFESLACPFCLGDGLEHDDDAENGGEICRVRS